MRKEQTYFPSNLGLGSAKSLFLRGFLICSLLVSACADFSAATRNNSGVSTACVDRDMSDGDFCTASPPSQNPEGHIPVSP
jgi:hypothetical protein